MALWMLRYQPMKQEMQSACAKARNSLSRVIGLYVKIQALMYALAGDSGQDLVEYALVLALIALAATASMQSVATAMGAAFTSVGTNIASNTT
jgi:pilus assembly protein Flp/PilA